MKRFLTFALLILAASSVALTKQPGRRSTNQGIRTFDLKKLAYQEAVKTLRQDWAEAVEGISKEGAEDDFVQAKNMQGFAIKSSFGDITADGSEEAAVRVEYNLGGSGEFTAVFVYTMKDKSPSLLARLAGGDRAHDGIETVRILSGELIVGRYKPTADDCNACYGFVETTRYKWKVSKLVSVGVQERKYHER
jgi:hypothetical protein